MVNLSIKIKQIIKKSNVTLLILTLVILCQTLISAVFPYLTKFIIDDILIKQSVSELKKISILITMLIILYLSLNMLISYLCSKWTQDVIYNLRKEISQFYFNSVDNPQKNGLFINSILSDCELIGNQLLNILINGFPNILLVFMYITILFLLNQSLVIVIFISLPMFFLLSYISSKKIFVLSKMLQSQRDMLLEYLNAHTRNKLLIHIYNLIFEEEEQFNKKIKDFKKNTIYANTILSFLNTLSGLIATIIPLATLLIGSYFVINNSMTIGSLISFNSYTGLIFVPIGKLLTLPTAISQLKVSLDRIEENTLPITFSHNGTYRREGLDKNQIIVTHDYLPFVENTPLLKLPISLCIKYGDIYRIVGRNGIGKSLFLQSIVHYYTNYSGKIIVSENVSIAYVPQENFLFDGTVKENLTKGLKNYDENDLQLFLKIFDFKVDLFQEVNSYSLKLSSGELQKIKLIRALLGNPDVLLLDEVFANMDQATTKTLIEYLLEHKITTIYVYHGELANIIDTINHKILNLDKYV